MRTTREPIRREKDATTQRFSTYLPLSTWWIYLTGSAKNLISLGRPALAFLLNYILQLQWAGDGPSVDLILISVLANHHVSYSRDPPQGNPAGVCLDVHYVPGEYAIFRKLFGYPLALVGSITAESCRIAIKHLLFSRSPGRGGTVVGSRSLLLGTAGLRRSCRSALRRPLG